MAVSDRTVDPAVDPAAAPGRRERNAVRTRAAITDAARRLFDEHGYDGTTIEQIADEADVAPRTVFRYFPTKESIVFAEFDDIRRGILERLDAAGDTTDPLRTLLAVLDVATVDVQERLDRLAWGFHIAKEHAASGVDNVLRSEVYRELAERIAILLGVDPDDDPRPFAWATIAMTLFGLAVKTAAQDPTRRTKVRTVYRRLVDETSAAFVS